MSMLVTIGSTSARRLWSTPSALVFSAVFYLMVTGVLAGLWSTAASTGSGEIAGYSAVALVWYVATTEAATISLPMRMIEELGDDVGSERVLVEMLRPASALLVRLVSQFGTMAPRLAVCIGLGVPYAWLIGGAPPHVGALLLALPALVLAVSVNIVAQHIFGSVSFWILDAKGAWFLYQKLVFVLGGMLIPLEVLPDWLSSVAKVLPFMAMAYAPGRLASGHFEPELILVQLLWLGVLSAVAFRVFDAGERHLILVER